jgi:hypothetical protein
MKTIIALLISFGTICACLGQGTVNWDLISSSAITVQTNTGTSSLFGSPSSGINGNIAPASSGQVFYFELLYNTDFTGSQATVPGAASLFGGTWLDTGLEATNSNIAGVLAPVNPTFAATVPWGSGTTNNIMLVGWSGNLGSSWATVSNELAQAALNGNYTLLDIAADGQPLYFGESSTGYIEPGSSNPGSLAFASGPTSYGLPIYSLDMQLYVPVPEPAALALAGVGAVSLFLFRRRL